MSKRRRRKKRRSTRKNRDPARSLSQSLTKVQELTNEDRLVEAAEELAELAQRHPAELLRG